MCNVYLSEELIAPIVRMKIANKAVTNDNETVRKIEQLFMNEIRYFIEKQEAERQDFLVIRLAKQDLKLAEWRKLASAPQEKEALTLLLKEEIAYQQRITGRTPHAETMPLNGIHVSPAQAIPILQLLASTQKLYFNDKQLVADFYGPVQFYYEANVQEDQSLAVSGHLKWRDTDIPLSECHCIGPGKPNWFIRGISLKLIATSISWKQLHQIYYSHPLILEGAQKTAFLEEHEDQDPDSPQIVIKGGTKEELQQQAIPLPQLVLKDRSGAFADLWMDYGDGQKILLQDPCQSIKAAQLNSALKRQHETEKNWEKDLLETGFVRKQTDSSHYYCPTDRVAKSLAFLLEIGWSIQDWRGNRVVKQTATQLNLEEKPDAIAVKGSVKFDDYDVDITQLIGAFNRRDQFVQLSPNTVGLLSLEREFDYLQEIAEEAELVGEAMEIKRNQFGTLSSLFQHAELTPYLKDFKDKIQNFTGINEALPSKEFTGQLRPYQQVGVNWLAFLHDYGLHGILADDMGLGKTIQVLALLSRLPEDRPHLIVMPTSLVFNWKKEIQQFLSHRSFYLHQGTQRARTVEELCQHSIVLTSYTTLRLDSSLMHQMDFHCVILDEAQMIKNPQTQTAQAVYGLKANFRLCITGTPIENRLSELWSHFHFLMPGLLGTLEAFEADVQAASADKRYLDRIKKKTAPFILRRSKRDVLKELPERIDQVVWIEMCEEQRSVYDQFLAGYKSNLLQKVAVDGMGKHRMEVLEAILRLRQICCHPLLISTLTEENQPLISSKFEAIEQDLETVVAEGRKALIYSQFTSMLKLMAQLAKGRGWQYSYLDGQTSDREKVVGEFQGNPAQSLFFISLKTGGVGLNLTAADYVFLYDPWWNEAVEDQAISRTHRIGREDVVIAKRLIMVDSIEEKMMKLKAMKRLAIDQILDDSACPSNLTVEDLEYLLSS